MCIYIYIYIHTKGCCGQSPHQDSGVRRVRLRRSLNLKGWSCPAHREVPGSSESRNPGRDDFQWGDWACPTALAPRNPPPSNRRRGHALSNRPPLYKYYVRLPWLPVWYEHPLLITTLNGPGNRLRRRSDSPSISLYLSLSLSLSLVFFLCVYIYIYIYMYIYIYI